MGHSTGLIREQCRVGQGVGDGRYRDREAGHRRDSLPGRLDLEARGSALAALSLVEEGRLTLDDPINEYLTTWSVPDNEFTADSAVTLRGLLTHSAGTTVWGFPGYRKDEPFRPGAVLATNSD